MQLFINGNLKTFDDHPLAVNELVEKMQLAGKRIAIELNGEILPRGQYQETFLHEGDKLEIVGAVGGG